MDEHTAEVPRPPLWHKLFWAEKSDHARLVRELNSFRVELELLKAKARKPDNAWAIAMRFESGNVQWPLSLANTELSDTPWAKAAHREIENAQEYVNLEKNVEGGWMSLHAARRHAVYGLSPGELLLQASMLRAEAEKIETWRGNEIKHLLGVKEEEITVHRIIDAMALRDEYFSNQYHKIWLVGRQITILLVCCALGLFLLLPLVISSSLQLQTALIPWGYQMVGAALFFGLFGAAFSAAGSLMNECTISEIPERVANQFVTIARTLFGSGAGLAGYALYQSKTLNFRFGDETGPGSALVVALIFGFGGELLIAKVLGSLGSSLPEAPK